MWVGLFAVAVVMITVSTTGEGAAMHQHADGYDSFIKLHDGYADAGWSVRVRPPPPPAAGSRDRVDNVR